MAAEISIGSIVSFTGVDVNASMRPRRMAAEIRAVRKLQRPQGHASMRPRRMAAEIGFGAMFAFVHNALQ